MIAPLLADARRHPLLTGLLITGLIIAAVEIPYLVLARSGSSLRTLPSFGAPRWEDRPAPAMRAPRLDGSGTIAVGGVPGSVTVVNFWASWCTACRAEGPHLEQIWRERSGPVRFVGVDVGDRDAEARAFERRFGITYPSAVDPRETLASRYGIFGLPFTFVIDGSGRIRAEIAGRISESSLRSVVARVLNA